MGSMSTSKIPNINFQDGKLIKIWEKLLSSERLSRDDGLAILNTWDLTALGKIANYVKKGKTDDLVCFVMNRQINPTNLCVLDCTFCDFAAKPGDKHAYEMNIKEILAKLNEELSEVHIVGGLHPKWKFEDYLFIIQEIHQAFPTVQIKAWTAVEIDWFARISRMSVEKVLEKLQEVGLQSLPGGGAEVFSERVREATFKHKMGADRWFEIHRIAHSMGIPSNATLLYGHIETYEERVEHMLRLRTAQDNTPGFLSFIPLALQPGNTGLAERQASAIEDLRTIACARLILDNFDHIKSYWVMLGEDSASIALNFGASDLDGTIGEERIAHYAQAKSALGLAREKLIAMIREAGKIPAERDALYNMIKIYN